MKILDNFAKDKPPKQIFVICEEKGDLLTKENTVSKFLKVVYQTKLKSNSQKLIAEIKLQLANSTLLCKGLDVIKQKRFKTTENYNFFITQIDKHAYCAFVFEEIRGKTLKDWSDVIEKIKDIFRNKMIWKNDIYEI